MVNVFNYNTKIILTVSKNQYRLKNDLGTIFLCTLRKTIDSKFQLSIN